MPAAPEVAMLFSTFDNIATKFRFPIKGILGWPIAVQPTQIK